MYLLKLLAIVLVGIILTVLVYGICLLLTTAVQSRSRRPKEPGFPYIYVEDDGEARELDAEEQGYLSTEFHPGDGGRPYIKAYYEALTPDGKMRGFLLRRQLPKHIPIND